MLNVISIGLLLFLGFLITKISDFFYNIALKRKAYKQLIKDAVPMQLDESKTCKGPHSWMKAGIVTEKGMGQTQICRICGMVSGTNTMASQEAIDKIEEINSLEEIQKRLWEEFLSNEDAQIKTYMEKEIQGGLDFGKLAAVHEAGMSFRERFSIYVESKKEYIEKEMRRGN